MFSKTGISRTAARIDLDIVERVAVVAVFLIFSFRTISTTLETGAYINLVLLTSEAAMAVFVIFRRRTTEMSSRGGDWLAGFVGTLAPLLVVPVDGHPLIPAVICATIMMLGFVLQMSAKLTLRRSFGIVAANRGVKASGPYRLIRHPMYAGYALTHIGFLLAGPSLWNLYLYSFVLCMQIVRIGAEERILGNDPAYRELSAAVPYRLMPHVY